MTRKDFILIANVIKDSRPAGRIHPVDVAAHEQCDATARAFADTIRSTNPNFDPVRFLAACGVTP